MGKYGRVLPKCWGIFTVKWQEKGAPEGAPERGGHALFFAGKDGHAKGSDSHESGRGGDHLIGAGGGVLLVLGLGGVLGGGDDDNLVIGGRSRRSGRVVDLIAIFPNTGILYFNLNTCVIVIVNTIVTHGAIKAPPQKDNKKPILRISEEGSVEIRRPFFLRISEEGADSRLAVRAPAI